MTKSDAVVLWGQDDLLSAAVELLISSAAGLRVVSVSADQPLARIKEVLEEVAATVLIAQRLDGANCSEIPTALLDELPGLKVILLSLNSNVIEVYSSERILVGSSGDLIAAIDSGFSVQPKKDGAAQDAFSHDAIPARPEPGEADHRRSVNDG